MNQSFRILVATLLLSAYTLSSIFGHVIVFNELVNGVSTKVQFNHEKKSKNSSTTPLWTQKKHIPISQTNKDFRIRHCNLSNSIIPDILANKYLYTNSTPNIHTEYNHNIHSHSPPASISIVRSQAA